MSQFGFKLPFIAILILGAFSLAGCGANPTPTIAPTRNAETPDAPQGLQIILAHSQNVVGENRFPIGIIRDGRSVQNAQVQLRFFDINQDTPIEKGASDAPFYGDNLGAAGVYVGRGAFDKAGNWGVEVTVTEPGHAPEVRRIAFQVLETDPTPAIGQPAPVTKVPTLKEVNGDRTKICSALDDDRELHTLSIDDAVKSGKPTVVLFATPRFCETRTCGPNLQVIQSLAKNYGERVNFIHVEVYKNFDTFEIADAMRAWNLQTEPWVFFIDEDGKIARKYEGGITSREIVPDFVRFIGG